MQTTGKPLAPARETLHLKRVLAPAKDYLLKPNQPAPAADARQPEPTTHPPGRHPHGDQKNPHHS